MSNGAPLSVAVQINGCRQSGGVSWRRSLSFPMVSVSAGALSSGLVCVLGRVGPWSGGSGFKEPLREA